MISSLIINMTADPLSAIGMATLPTLAVSAAACGFVIPLLAGDNGITVTSLSSLLLCLVMLIVGLVSARGGIEIGALINYASYVAIATLVSRLGARKNKHRTRRS